MIPQVVTLPNGLRVVFVDTKAFPTLTTLLLVGAGSRYENKDNNGIAHFFEHMAFKGSKKYPSSFIISSTIEGEGGAFNAFTAKDHTGYYIKALTEDFDIVVDVLSDMILNPLLAEDEIEREKGVIIEEINMYEDTPYRKVGELFDLITYKGNPLQMEIAGSKDTVNAVTKKTFTDYINQLYHPKNAVLVLAGSGYQQEKLFATIQEKFKNWKHAEQLGFETVSDIQTKPQSMIKFKKTEQVHYCLGFRTFSFLDIRRYPMSVLSAILGGGMSSRLFIEVRERRGLCYYISTGRELYQDVGSFVTQAGITNDLSKVKESIEVILKEHQKMAKGEISDEEITKAKELIKGRLLLSMEDSFNVASFFGTKILLKGSMETPEEVIKQIEKVTKEDIVSVAQEIFKPERLNFSMIGPIEEDAIKIEDFSL